MPDHIEIRPDGEVLSSYLTVGRIEFSTPFPREFAGDWFIYDPREEVDDLKEAMEAAEKAADEEIEDLRDGLSEAESDLREAQSSLSGLMDEVRAFLVSDHSDEARERLAAHLEGLE